VVVARRRISVSGWRRLSRLFPDPAAAVISRKDRRGPWFDLESGSGAALEAISSHAFPGTPAGAIGAGGNGLKAFFDPGGSGWGG